MSALATAAYQRPLSGLPFDPPGFAALNRAPRYGEFTQLGRTPSPSPDPKQGIPTDSEPQSSGTLEVDVDLNR